MPFNKLQFDRLFYPRHIAIIGASAKVDKVGYALLKNLLDMGYQGKLFPINPNLKQVFGIKVYPSLSKIKGSVDLAIIILKAQLVPEALEECQKKHVSTIVIISAGFKETGTTSGQLLEDKMINIVGAHDLLVIGPNCLGVVNTDSNVNLNATFARAIPRKGNLAFISQSGAIGIHALEFAEKHDIGFSKFITIGNKSVVDENDLIEYLLEDPKTRAILLYVESFADGIRFKEILKRNDLSNKKPVILLKSGRSESGKMAALSHTGALAVADGMTSFFLEDCHAIRVNTIQELFTTAMVMANQPVPKGKKLMVITNAGGLGIMAMDATENHKLVPAKLTNELQLKLKKNLPPAASVNNPIDILGDADATRYKDACNELLQSKAFDMLLIICTPQFMTKRDEILESLESSIKTARKYDITLAAVFPAVKDPVVDSLFDQYDLPNYEFPEQATEALANYVRYSDYLKITDSPESYKLSERKYNHIKKLLDESISDGQGYLDEVQSYKLLKEYGLHVGDHHLAHSLEDCIKYAGKLGFPLVAKIVAKGVIHKYDIGGVIVNITNEKDLIGAYKQLSGLVEAKRFKGVLLQTMVIKGIELIIGAKLHRGFGHAIMFGLGGTYVEVMGDVSFAMVPLTKMKAKQLIESIKGVKLLDGYRSQPAVNKEAIVQLLMKISHIVSDFPEITSLDLNPVFASEKEVVVADARVILY